MLKVGITGGIGSGKTTVCRIFEALDIPVYYADDRAKALMVEDEELIKKIKNIFGAKAYHEDGSLNKLALLNAAVHPAVFNDGINWHNSQEACPYTLKEAALLFEAGSYKELDKVITVTAPQDIRMERLLLRDQTSREAIKARMDKQMPDAEKVERADFVIYNDGEQSLILQVMNIHQQLIAENISERIIV